MYKNYIISYLYYYIRYLIFITILLITNLNIKTIYAEELNKNRFTTGLELFKNNCSSCHDINFKREIIGPTLKEIFESKDINWLRLWIKDNKSLIKKKEKNAIYIYEKYNKLDMPIFNNLSNIEIDNILFFIKEKVTNNKQDNNFSNTINKNVSDNIILYNKIFNTGYVLLLLLLSIIIVKLIKLFFVTNKLDIHIYRISILLIRYFYMIFLYIKKKIFIIYVLLSIVSIYNIIKFIIYFDVNTGYKPEQPIYFSHKIHSGINNIDCRYCHFNVEYSKHSDIPSLSICMNCHFSIKEYKGKYIEHNKNIKFYNNEINKIYTYINWDPIKRKFITNNNNIKWNKVYHLPDYVFFDHSQHVTVAENYIKGLSNDKIICTTCHGKVYNMDEIYMYNDLTMEWCINCHKNAKLDINNEYYKYHYKLNNLNNKKLNLSISGGEECGKCHY